MATSGLIEPMI